MGSIGRTHFGILAAALLATGGAVHDEMPRSAVEAPLLPYDGPPRKKRKGKPLSKRTAPKRKPNRAKGRKPRGGR